MRTKISRYQKEKSRLYKLLSDRVITNYDRLHYLHQDENSKIVINNDSRSVSYYYNFASPVVEGLFSATGYKYIELVPGYFSLQATNFVESTGYKVETVENKVSIELPVGKVSISFHSYFSLFDYMNNMISGPYVVCKTILDPYKDLYYEVSKEVYIPKDFYKRLFVFRSNNEQDISACLRELSELRYLSQERYNLTDFIQLLHENLTQIKESYPIRVFFSWRKFFQSIYMNWIVLSIDQSFVGINRQQNQYKNIIIPSYSVGISIMNE